VLNTGSILLPAPFKASLYKFHKFPPQGNAESIELFPFLRNACGKGKTSGQEPRSKGRFFGQEGRQIDICPVKHQENTTIIFLHTRTFLCGEIS